MDAYTNFASVYDTFMDNIPYEKWGEYLHGLLKEHEIKGGLVLELGCGTGTMTELLAEKGYDMIGLDCSLEMLEIAQEKRQQSGFDILYLLQDMREFELYGTVRAIISVCDSLNYITEQEELEQVFRLADNYLDPDGVFIFDFNTEYKYKEILGDRTIAESREDCSFIWDNYYYEEEKINEYELNLFVKINDSEAGKDLYQRYTETHFQRAYTIEEIEKVILDCNMHLEAMYDGFTKEMPTEHTERVCMIVRKGKK